MVLKINLSIENLNIKLNLTNKHDGSFAETLQFIDKLNLKSPEIKATLASYMSEYKTKIKLKIQKKALNLIENHHREQVYFENALGGLVREQENLFNTNDLASNVQTTNEQTAHKNFENISKFIDKALNIDETCFQAECSIGKNEKRKFLMSLYFVVASLTSIGKLI